MSVADIRNQVSSVDIVDPLEAARALLHLIQPFPNPAVELDKIHFNHAMTKLNVLGLLSAEPRDPTTGQPIDVTRLLDNGSPLRTIVDNVKLPLANTIANRVVMAAGSGRSVQQLLVSADPEVAESHLVDPSAQRLLAAGQLDVFLSRRADASVATIQTHVTHMAEWGARDGRAVADLLRSVA